jgi:hypothetical protein
MERKGMKQNLCIGMLVAFAAVALGDGIVIPGGSEGSLPDSTVVSADIKNGTILGADIRTNTVGKANLAAADFGDFTVGADGTCELDSGSVGSAEVSNGSLLGADIRTNTVGKANLAAADFGDFTVGADGTCTIDSTAVGPTKVGEGVVVSPTGYSGTGVKVQLGTVPTNATATVTFSDVFGATPAVVICPESNPGTNIFYVSAVNMTNFTYVGKAGVGGGYIAVGLK